jgi:hypothetical protein
MKYWKCPKCKRVRKYNDKLVMKICYTCQIEMEVFDDINSRASS